MASSIFFKAWRTYRPLDLITAAVHRQNHRRRSCKGVPVVVAVVGVMATVLPTSTKEVERAF